MSAPLQVSAAEGYALWAGAWDSTPSPIAALEDRALRPWIAALHPHCAIDVGCGTGRWTTRLSAIGFDASPAMLAIAASKPGLHGRLAVADAVALPIRSGVAGLLLCALTFGHIRDRAGALAEFARVLEPGGTLILTDFHPNAAAQGWRRTFRHNGAVYELENHPYSLEQLCDLAPELSLRESAEVHIGETERELFHRAGRPELFAAACAQPAVLMARWVRR